MPRCLICDTTYYAQSHSEPAEPCDCGRNFSTADWREEDGDFSLDAARKAFKVWINQEPTVAEEA